MTKKKVIIISIIFIIIILLLSIFLILSNKTKHNKNSTNEIDIKELEEIKKYENGFIYMNKTDNVTIENNNKYNNSKKVEEVHSYEKFKFENAKIYTENGMSYFEFDAVNLSYVSISDLPDNIMIGFLNNEGKEFYTATYELPKIEIGETKHEKFEYPYDVSNSYDYKFYLWG